MNKIVSHLNDFAQRAMNLLIRSRHIRRRLYQRSRIPAMVHVLEPRNLLSAFSVTTLADAGQGSLREAITLANNDPSTADTITFSPSLFPNNTPGTITLQSTLLITSSVSITGPGANVLSITGQDEYQIFKVNDSTLAKVQVTIAGLTLTHGHGDAGGAIENNESLTLSNNVISHNVATYNGGGVFNADIAILNSNDNQYAANEVDRNFGRCGGAVYNSGTMNSLNDSYISNFAPNGGGVFHNTYGTLICTNGIFRDNQAHFTAGGVLNFGKMTSFRNSFLENTAGNTGGAIQNYGVLNSTNDTIGNNHANKSGFFTHGGSGISNYGSLITVNDTIAGNDANGIRNDGNGTWNSLNTIVAGNLLAPGSTMSSDVANTSTVAIIARFTLIGDANSEAGVIHGTNGNIVGASVNSIFVTQNGVPLLDGSQQTFPLIENSPAINAGGAITTLTSAITSTSTTTLTVGDFRSIAVGDMLRIDGELVVVTDVTSSSMSVQRGQLKTLASTHANNSLVVLATDRRGVIRSGVDMGSFAQDSSPPLPGGATVISSKVNSNGLVHALTTNGNLYSWAGPGVTWKQIDSDVRKFDFAGNGDVVTLHNNGVLWEQSLFGSVNTLVSSQKNWVQIHTDVLQFAIAGNGDVVTLQNNSEVREFTDYRHPSAYLTIARGAKSIGVAGNGDLVTLLSNGSLRQFTAFRHSFAFIQIGVGVTSFGIAGNGDVVALLSDATLREYTAFRNSAAFIRIGVGIDSFDIAGNGDVVARLTNRDLRQYTAYRSFTQFITLASGVTSMGIAGNGDVVALMSNQDLRQYTAYRNSAAFIRMGINVISFGIAGNGDVVELVSNGHLRQFTTYRNFSEFLTIDTNVAQFRIARNGLVQDQRRTSLYYTQTSPRGLVNQQIPVFS